MRFGLIYSTPWIYEVVLWFLYRNSIMDRFNAVADEIEIGDVVVDLCAGTSLLHEVLSDKSVYYKAYDINPVFVKVLRSKGIDAHCCDVERMDIPSADIITMSSALYHFYPNCQQFIERMCMNARKKVILVEPVNNHSNSSFHLWGEFARWMSRVNNKDVPFHFDLQSFNLLLDEVKYETYQRVIIGSGRDMLVIFPGMLNKYQEE